MIPDNKRNKLKPGRLVLPTKSVTSLNPIGSCTLNCTRDLPCYILLEGLRPEVQPLILFHIPFFDRKGTPFTYLVKNFASVFTAVNTLSLIKNNMKKSQNQNVFSTFQSHKMHVIPFEPVTNRNDRCPYPFIYFNL